MEACDQPHAEGVVEEVADLGGKAEAELLPLVRSPSREATAEDDASLVIPILMVLCVLREGLLSLCLRAA